MFKFQKVLEFGLGLAMAALWLGCSGSKASGSGAYSITSSAGAGGSVLPAGTTQVRAGGTATYAVTPDRGYVVDTVTVDGSAITGATAYTFSDVQGDHSLVASFKAAADFHITVAAGPNGSISPGAADVPPGGGQTFTITADAGYQVTSVQVDGTDLGALASYAFTSVQADHTISASFGPAPQFTIQVTPGPNGTISPLDTRVFAGADQAFTIQAAAGFAVGSVLVDGIAQGALATYTFHGVRADHTLSAVFLPAALTINATAGANGTISPAGATSVASGGLKTFLITPDPAYVVGTVTVDGVVHTGDIPSYTFSNVSADHEIDVTFMPSPATFTIAVTPGPNGTISPTDAVVASGAAQTFTITPADGYDVADVLVDGKDQKAITTYTFPKVLGPHAISARFVAHAPTDADSMTRDFGVKTNLGDPTDPATGKALPDNYNPFGSANTVVTAIRETFVDNTIYEEFSASTTSVRKASGLPAAYQAYPSLYPHAAASGDLTNVGKDSIVEAYYVGPTTVYDPTNYPGTNTGKVMLFITGPDGTVAAPITVDMGIYQPIEFFVKDPDKLQGQVSVALCDVDGDGLLDVAIVVDSTFLLLHNTSTDPANPAFQLGFWWNYRYNNSLQDDFSTSPVNSWWSCRLATGDINGDGRDEIVVVQGILDPQVNLPAIYHVYGWSDANAWGVELASSPITDSDGTTLLNGNVAIGDLLGDNGREILFSGCSRMDKNGRFLDSNVLMGTWKSFADPSGDGTILLPGGSLSLAYNWPSGSNNNLWQIMPTACFRQVPGQAQSLLALNRVINFDANAGRLTILSNLPESGKPDYLEQGLQHLAVGDVDGDGEEEIVALYTDAGDATRGIYVYKTAGKVNLLEAAYHYPLAPATQDTRTIYDTLCLPDVEGKSIRLHFTGKGGLVFTNPNVMALIAAPPYWGSLAGQYANIGNCFTSWGRTADTSKTTSNGLTFDAQFTIGHDTKLSFLGFDLNDASIRLNVKTSLSYNHTHAFDSSYTQTYSTPYFEDQVVFSCTPYDVYFYTTMDYLAHPTAYTTPPQVVIMVPRQTQVIPMELKAYNAVPGNTATVPANFMGHTIGSPYSYLNKDAVSALMIGNYLWDSKGLGPGFNSGYATSSAEQTVNNSNSCGFGFGVSVAFENTTAGGLIIGAEAGLTYSHEEEWSTGSGTTISGSSPGMPVGTPADKLYTFGIASYQKSLPTQGSDVAIITYWVEPSK